MNGSNYKYSKLTDELINAFYDVYNTLGFGFLEKVYEKALMVELKSRNIKAESQKKIQVQYAGVTVGDYYADIIANDKVLIEIKASEKLCEEDTYQLINYLKASEMEVGLLLNFGRKPEVKRKVFNNLRKRIINRNS